MKSMKILVIDGQGGGVGKQLCSCIKKNFPAVSLTAVGTNSTATSAMLKGGADQAATGENAVIVACRKADLIVGPLGIVLADSLLGEITPAMAQAVAQAEAKRILLPFHHCDHIIVGVADFTLSKLLEQTVREIRTLLEEM